LNRRNFLFSSLGGAAASALFAADEPAAKRLPIGLNSYCLRAMRWSDAQLIDYTSGLKLDAIFLQIEKPFTDSSVWGFTEAITLQRAKSNVAQELNSDEFFNGPALDAYGWNHVNGVEKWRTVTSANWRAPYGITLSGTLTLSSGPAFGHIVFGGAPEGACCYASMGGVYFPKKDIAYKRLDARIAKTFKMPWGHEATIDFEAFNVFNWLNRTYSTWGAGNGNPPPFKENGQVANDQRQFQVGLKYKF